MQLSLWTAMHIVSQLTHLLKLMKHVTVICVYLQNRKIFKQQVPRDFLVLKYVQIHMWHDYYW
jgi:hypothetical protein